MNRKTAPSGQAPQQKMSGKGWARTAGLLFLAASAVYNGRAIAASVGKAAGSAAVTVTPVSDAGAQAVAADSSTTAAADAAKGQSRSEAKADAKPAMTQPAEKPAA